MSEEDYLYQSYRDMQLEKEFLEENYGSKKIQPTYEKEKEKDILHGSRVEIK